MELISSPPFSKEEHIKIFSYKLCDFIHFCLLEMFANSPGWWGNQVSADNPKYVGKQPFDSLFQYVYRYKLYLSLIVMKKADTILGLCHISCPEWAFQAKRKKGLIKRGNSPKDPIHFLRVTGWNSSQLTWPVHASDISHLYLPKWCLASRKLDRFVC